jgi:hypothetical protein
VYEQFARMDVRSGIREIFASYDDDGEVLANLKKINGQIDAEAVKVFAENKVPLKLQNSKISNTKVDDVIWQAETKRAAAAAEADRIRIIGEAVRNNPGYIAYAKWNVIEKSGVKDVTVIDNASGSPIAISPK